MRSATAPRRSTLVLLGLLGVLLLTQSSSTGVLEDRTPDLRIVGWTIDDSYDGNGDGGLHPGETAYLVVHLSNQGQEIARFVDGQIDEVVDHPDVEILDRTAVWTDLSPSGAPAPSDAHFLIQVAQTRPCGWVIPLRLELYGEDGYFAEETFVLTLVDSKRIDLAQGAARPFYYGADTGDAYGGAVGTGDIDGDGYDDLILGAEFGDGPAGGRADAGEVAIVYGGPALLSDVDLDDTTSISGRSAFVFGVAAGDRLGSSVASGDVDGDGFDDLILGARNGNAGSGQVAIVYGAPTRLSNVDLAAPPLSSVAFIDGKLTFDNLGSAVASGDLDDDSYDDLVLGSPSEPAQSETGEVAVIYGRSSRILGIDLASAPSDVVNILGGDVWDELGRAIATGDVNGDGFDDLILGVPGGDGPTGSGVENGEAVVVYAGATRLSDIDLASPPSNVSFVYGAEFGDRLGDNVRAADLDGDGHDDLILAAYLGDGHDSTEVAAGEVVVLYGGAAQLPDVDLADSATIPADTAVISGADDSDWLGFSVGSADLDGDGFDDLILGASNGDGTAADPRPEAGEVAVLFGSPNRLNDINLVSPPPSVVVFDGAASNDALGHAVAAGDLDGDGFDDLVIGASGADGPDDVRVGAGEVAVIPGQPRSRYRHDSDAYAFIDATVGTDTGLACDDCGVAIPIGFDFGFYGKSFDTVTVSSNGYLSFEGSGDRLPGACPPWAPPPNDLIAVFWDDLNLAAGGGVHYLLEGTAPNRRLTVEWSQVPRHPATDAATFEVTLFETTDQILFQYQDVTFGNFSDNGGAAIAGVENASGFNGMAVSCFNPAIADLSAVRLRRFANPTLTEAADLETDVSDWTATGLWHITDDLSVCTPNSRSGVKSFYYGQETICTYNDGTANAGDLTSPLVPALQQDAAFVFWHRREIDPFEADPLHDLSIVQVDDDGDQIFDDLRTIDESSGGWLYSDDYFDPDGENRLFSELDLSAFVGLDIQVRWHFDAVDGNANNGLGWMVDDINLRYCPVWTPGGGGGGGGFAAEARATAQPEVYCEGQAGRVDALGSYCTACDTLTYQWSEDGAPITGATGVAYDIPDTKPANPYDYTVEIDCATNPDCGDESNVAGVTIHEAPAEVGPTLTLGKADGVASVEFHWSDVSGAVDYVLFADADPGGGFVTEEGSASSGVGGISVPMPGAAIVYYVVAARNPGCGLGPR